MGYSTDFTGSFRLDRPMQLEHARYLHAFGHTRRMKRAAQQAEQLPDRVRASVGLPIGDEGGYFVGGQGVAGQDRDLSIVDYNKPPKGQPGLWCQWVPSEDQRAIIWDGGEKFYDYVEWLEYLIEHFLKPWGYVLKGEVHWAGEEHGDTGVIRVEANRVTTVAVQDERDPGDWGAGEED